jgi:hypothetical protein
VGKKFLHPRRSFLKAVAATAAGLTIGGYLSGCSDSSSSPQPTTTLVDLTVLLDANGQSLLTSDGNILRQS